MLNWQLVCSRLDADCTAVMVWAGCYVFAVCSAREIAELFRVISVGRGGGPSRSVYKTLLSAVF